MSFGSTTFMQMLTYLSLAAADCVSGTWNPCMPDVSITFDYNVVGIPAETEPDIPTSASVWTSFTSDIPDIINTFVPYNLLSDVHLIGSWTFN